jgi:hypothetical protein
MSEPFNAIHARAASGTGALTLCGKGVRISPGAPFPVDCPTCLEMLDRIEEVGRKQVGGYHYASLAIEPWDVMRAISEPDPERFDPFQWHLLFTALKYLMRAGRKGPAKEDIAKARHYLEELENTYD